MEWIHSILKHYNVRKNDTNTSNTREGVVTPDEKLLKSFKDRFNYASSSCSARILSSNPETLSASAVLSANKDAYMRNSCSVKNKFLVVELCEDVKVDGIILGNYELFSSTFKGFKVHAAIKSTDPSQQIIWKLLLTAQMSSDSKFLHSDQAFPIESSLFFKYLRIEFDDEFHGHEELCPLSALKVYGKNMIDEFVEEHKTSEIVNYENTDFQISEELKGIYKRMEEITLKLAQIDRPFNTTANLLNHCPIGDSEIQILKASYAELEEQALLLQQASLAAAKSNGNIFKLINNRLSKLEITVKNPLNLILFRSARSPNDPSIQSSSNTRLILDASDHENSRADERSFEDLFARLNQNLFTLQGDFKRLQSEMSLQQTKVSILIVLNCALFLVIIIQFFIKRRTNSFNIIKQPALKRRPLLELKSPSSLSSSLSRSSGEINPASKNTPGVVLSDDEVLLLDEDKDKDL